jgi:hypothetical protein
MWPERGRTATARSDDLRILAIGAEPGAGIVVALDQPKPTPTHFVEALQG